MKELKHTKGALSSDYGVNRERLNSRCGTRQKSRFKISSNNKQPLESLPHTEGIQLNSNAKTVSGRRQAKTDASTEWLRFSEDVKDKHKQAIANAQQSSSIEKSITIGQHNKAQSTFFQGPTQRQDHLRYRLGSRACKNDAIPGKLGMQSLPPGMTGNYIITKQSTNKFV